MTSRPEGTSTRRVARFSAFTSLKAEMILSLAVLSTAALSLAALNVIVLRDLVMSPHGALYLALLIIADVIVFVAFGAYKVQGLVLDPIDRVVDATEAIANGDLTRRVPQGSTIELARLARSINRMTSRLLEEQAQRGHLEKVASVGRLAAGVAHEIGNPLGAIDGYAHLLRRSMDGDVDAADAIVGIQRESARIDRIMRGMLDYARPRRRTLGPTNLNDAVRRVAEMLTDQGALRHSCLTLALNDQVPHLTGDAHELEQVMVNLLLNAVDAMNGGGTISVVTQCIPFSEITDTGDRRRDDPAVIAIDRQPNARVRAWLRSVGELREVITLVVADSGPGIPWSESERVFDPFFTTKEPGKGTGLGLAIVARIVEGLGGTVWVREAREGGAAFVIYFPVPLQEPDGDAPIDFLPLEPAS
ncbi:MAG TPA: ATP-binding protein [Gemmatimonadaceae bacterium]|nr:ATP-binding protein [Gemmatimonadaceae bacterium]